MPQPAPPLPALGPRTLVRALFQRAALDAPLQIESRYDLECIDAGQLQRYQAAFGFPTAQVPISFLYLLAQRAHLATTLDYPVPFRIPGMVHVANRLSRHAHINPALGMSLETRLRLLPPNQHGALYCELATHAYHGEQPLFDCHSTYLVRRGQRKGEHAGAAAPAGTVIGQWSLASNAGRRYARLSGDWNPIHLSRLAARVMGLPGPIIHGAHTLAMSCAHLERRTKMPLTMIEARFRAPIALGSQLQLVEQEGGRFAVLCGGNAAVVGEYAGREYARQEA